MPDSIASERGAQALKVTDVSGFGSIGREIVRATSAAIGRVYTPTAIRNQADAKAYEIETLAVARAKANQVLAIGRENIARRAAERVYAEAIREQSNIEAVVDQALLLTLDGHASVKAGEAKNSSDEYRTVPPEWMTRFIDCARFASTDDIRTILAHILKEEASSQEGLSVRLLECVKALTPDDIQMFAKFRWVIRELGEPVAWEDQLFGVVSCCNFVDDFSQEIIDSGLVQCSARAALVAKGEPVPMINFDGKTFVIINETEGLGYIKYLCFTKNGAALDRILGDDFLEPPDISVLAATRAEIIDRMKNIISFTGMRIVEVLTDDKRPNGADDRGGLPT